MEYFLFFLFFAAHLLTADEQLYITFISVVLKIVNRSTAVLNNPPKSVKDKSEILFCFLDTSVSVI